VQFIDTLRLKTKLVILFVLISAGLTLVGILGYLNITAMKKSVDELYFGSFIPLNELNSLIHLYPDGIASTVYKVKNRSISADQASEKLSYTLDEINRLWSSYASHYKSEKELLYVKYTEHTLKNTNRDIERIIQICQQKQFIQKISTRKISETVDKMQAVLQKLLQYEKEVAHHERKNFLTAYDGTMLQLSILLTLIISGILFLSLMIFRSIHQHQDALEKTSQMLIQANSDLERSSYTDSLTGIYNRRYFNLVYERELKRSKRNGSFFTFMMLDIDFFKLYNDTYGHIEGDNALKAVAAEIRRTLHRPGDYLFRLGGEEFGVIITETDTKNSGMMAEKIRRNIEALEIEHEKNSASRFVTVSIGLTTLIPAVSLKEEVILSEADVNLYKAKENGRNQIAISTSTLKKNDAQARGVVA